jgi:tetratricopeptide (TPR) repeat protein
MDTPQAHVNEGMKYYNNETFTKAMEEFNLALSLDPEYAPAYAGIALTAAAQGDLEHAERAADKAHSLDAKLPEAYVASAIVIAAKNKKRTPADWLPSMEKEFAKAIKLAPADPEIYYRRGSCYKNAFAFEQAANDFRKVLDSKGDWTGKADEQWQLIQMIQRAVPGSDVGKQIALVNAITRADIAALFVSELHIDNLIAKKRPNSHDTGFKSPTDSRVMNSDSSVQLPKVTDISGHWAKNFINDILDYNIRGLEPYPDHTFHPDQLINRSEYAMMVEECLIAITGNQSLATQYIGTQSRFSDVNASHPSYNAICNAVDKNIMDASINGEFGPEKSVSGPEALLVIRKLKELKK